MHCTDILAAVAMAATNLVPVPHLLQHQIKMMHADNVLLLWQHQKMLGGGKNSPQMNLLCTYWTWCYYITTQRHQATTPVPGAETIQTESSNHDKLMVWFQFWMWLADGAVIFWWGKQQKLMLRAISGSQWEIGWLGGQFLDPNVNQDIVVKPFLRALKTIMKNMVFSLWKDSTIFFKGVKQRW
jgi:hypothetical protein